MKIINVLRSTIWIWIVFGWSQSYAVDTHNDPVRAMQTLQSSTVNGHFLKYLRYYQGQITTKTCGLASAAMVLNTLDIEAPFVPEYYPVKQFNQLNFLNEKNSAIRSFKQIEEDGITMPELAQMLSVGWPVDAVVYHGSELSLEEFRKIIVDTLGSEGQRLIGNLKISQPEGAGDYGHLSPIAAYNKDSDEVLIMDVARYSTGPYWVSVGRLHQATQAIDSSSGKSRGLLVIKAG